jgi:Uncharacterized oxidoreductase dhs-27
MYAVSISMSTATPRTLIHNDVQGDNLLVAGDGEQSLVFVDWQLTTAARPFLDLAGFLVGCLDTAERRRYKDRLLEMYHSALIKRGVVGYSLEQCRDDYRLALVPRASRLAGAVGHHPGLTATPDGFWNVVFPRYARALADLGVAEHPTVVRVAAPKSLRPLPGRPDARRGCLGRQCASGVSRFSPTFINSAPVSDSPIGPPTTSWPRACEPWPPRTLGRDHAAKSEMTGRAAYGMTLSSRGSVAMAVRRCAQVRTALDNSPVLLADVFRARGTAGMNRRADRRHVVGRPGSSRPLPDIAGDVVEAVPVWRKPLHRRCPAKAMGPKVLPWEFDRAMYWP